VTAGTTPRTSGTPRRNARYTPLDADGPLPLDMIRAVPAISRDPLRWLEQAVARYGDLVAFPMPRSAVLLANTPAAARQVLQLNHTNYTKATVQYGALCAVTGQGLLTADHPAWLRHRRAVQPAFHPGVLPALADLTVRAASAPGHWAGVPAGPGGVRRVDADAAAMRVMLDVVTACLFSQATGPQSEAVIGAVDEALHAVVARVRSPLVGPLARLPSPARRRQQRAVATLDAACARLVAGRRAGEAHEDLLGLLLSAQDAGALDAREVRDEIVTLIIAGYETVASSLAWTLDLVAGHDAVQQQIHAELDRVLAGRAPGGDDLAALPYLRAVVQESLRLFPPAWVITRRATGSDEVGGIAVPAGTLVILSPWLLHRRDQEWHRPLSFEPARFAVAGVRREGYLPFGAGPRLCIGREVALMQATLVLAQVLSGHRITRPEGAAAPGVQALVTLRPRNGMPLLFSPRVSTSRAPTSRVPTSA
jgi:cytochrome P450